jgi:hypothetical protein
MIGNNEETEQMVLAMVLARLQAQGKKAFQLSDDEMQACIMDAINDLLLTESILKK